MEHLHCKGCRGAQRRGCAKDAPYVLLATGCAEHQRCRDPHRRRRVGLAQQRVHRLPCVEPPAWPPAVAVGCRVGEDVEEQPVDLSTAAAARVSHRARVWAVQRVDAPSQSESLPALSSLQQL